MSKRIARKDYAKLRRLAKHAEKESREYREWREEKCDELKCYGDEWMARVGYIRRGTEFVNGIYIGEREKVDEKLTKEARKREDELRRKAEKIDRLMEKLAEKHEVLPSDIDLKTGEVKTGEVEWLAEVGDDEEDAKDGTAAGA